MNRMSGANPSTSGHKHQYDQRGNLPSVASSGPPNVDVSCEKALPGGRQVGNITTDPFPRMQMEDQRNAVTVDAAVFRFIGLGRWHQFFGHRIVMESKRKTPL